jgi:hypothetical protein
MCDLNYCLERGLIYEPIERIADVSGIGEHRLRWMVL